MTQGITDLEKSNSEKFTDIHPRHPLYLYPSDTPGSILIPQQLTGIENYVAWSNSMRVALLAKNKLGFIDGKYLKEHYKGDLEHEWERYLKERFDKKNLTRVYQLLREICTINQGTASISEYFSKLKNAWDEYWSMVALLCDCEKHKKYEEHMEQHKLVQFLMGLNETYAQARSQVLLIVPVPTLNQAYNMIMQDESQRTQSSMISQLSTGLQQMNMIDPTAFAFTQNNKSKKNNGMYCNYCHLKVHLKENCYSWLDIPQVISLIEERALTDQYQQLLKLINQEPTVAESRANMVGIKELLTTCLLAGSEPDSLVIDTGASNHMVSSLNLLTKSTLVKSNFNKVHLPNGHTTSVTTQDP
ncbi:uncharacterized protein [Nicotiana sylvestris]|uniref:uncharacterized protein n=1 Tax=Nicotiana sylvestris TaxID=4096 RepID=UPI00388CA9E0